ncbi:bL17 family ribosomal protein [Candidatus Absconditicoccus praedator]|uniref:bL17 family ribosomal protein n=1 Tax=Candidatus Absconditicoccus praedator TaxID=2735562 RepID=UPI001E3491D3|nr:bL17 family ribosomal protein [Candidatus Absconditicoccus praedator]UFX82851.1 hypothetical protein HLG78_01800 [Candidatus Absconditicoccus praedator]
MRHKYNKLKQVDTGIQKKEIVFRNMLTSLIKNGQIKTTPKRAKVLISTTDKFLSSLMGLFDKYEEKEVRRLAISKVKSYIMTRDEGKKVVDNLLPKYKEEGRKTGFTTTYKLGFRKGDGVEEVLVKLV